MVWAEEHTHTHTHCCYCTQVALPGYGCHSEDTNGPVHATIPFSRSSLGLWGREKHFPISYFTMSATINNWSLPGAAVQLWSSGWGGWISSRQINDHVYLFGAHPASGRPSEEGRTDAVTLIPRGSIYALRTRVRPPDSGTREFWNASPSPKGVVQGSEQLLFRIISKTKTYKK